ncbi:MAG: ATP-binding cassette domain-containing protein, partial [Pseudomonadota bacterium]
MSLLDVQNLSMRIGNTPILRDVSFDIAPGEIFALVGESGSGKTMTALAAIGLLPGDASTKGRVLLGDQDLMHLSEAQLCDIRGRDIGVIFQEPMTALNPMHRIADQVAETLLTHGEATRAQARDVALSRLARVGLPPDKYDPGRYPHELSGGQRQRVSIAMAIALRPRLLIADEPTTALDVTTQAKILELLKDLVADEGMALMLITHDLAVVANTADRVGVMQNGKIVETGATEPLFRTRNHPYTQKLFAASTHQPRRARHATAEPLLRVQNVSRDYPMARRSPFGARPVFRAVKDVSLDVAEGESVGLVGESGCGKSTLVRAILGLDP